MKLLSILTGALAVPALVAAGESSGTIQALLAASASASSNSSLSQLRESILGHLQQQVVSEPVCRPVDYSLQGNKNAFRCKYNTGLVCKRTKKNGDDHQGCWGDQILWDFCGKPKNRLLCPPGYFMCGNGQCFTKASKCTRKKGGVKHTNQDCPPPPCNPNPRGLLICKGVGASASTGNKLDWGACGSGKEKFSEREYCPRGYARCTNGRCYQDQALCEKHAGVAVSKKVCPVGSRLKFPPPEPPPESPTTAQPTTSTSDKVSIPCSGWCHQNDSSELLCWDTSKARRMRDPSCEWGWWPELQTQILRRDMCRRKRKINWNKCGTRANRRHCPRGYMMCGEDNSCFKSRDQCRGKVTKHELHMCGPQEDLSGYPPSCGHKLVVRDGGRERTLEACLDFCWNRNPKCDKQMAKDESEEDCVKSRETGYFHKNSKGGDTGISEWGEGNYISFELDGCLEDDYPYWNSSCEKTLVSQAVQDRMSEG